MSDNKNSNSTSAGVTNTNKPKPKSKPKPSHQVSMTNLKGNQYQIKVNEKRVFLGTENACAMMMENKKGLINLYEQNYGK